MDTFQIGPAGGNGGKPFEHYDVPSDAHLIAIHIYTEWVLNAIQFEYSDSDGNSRSRPPIGGLGGEHHVFYLDDDEYLTGISGRAGWYIDSLRIHTNKRVSKPFGGAGGDRDFSFLAPDGHEIGGLFGRSEWYIDALGVSVRPHIDSPTEDEGLEDEDDVESWLELAGEGEPLAASVVVRREMIRSNDDLEKLEDAALAEAIAGLGGEHIDEGMVDAAIYTQVVDDKEHGQSFAIVLAVASEVSGGTSGEEPDEIAVMVTDAIESEEDIAMLEEEAVEGAIDTLLEELQEEADEVDVTIYSGVHEDEASGKAYAAVVAIATRIPSAAEAASRVAVAGEKETRQPKAKELELVEGIGPKIAELLIAHDIYDLADLAVAPVDRLREILKNGGRRFRLADPGTWPEQAALGVAGQWDALSDLQTRLKAGR